MYDNRKFKEALTARGVRAACSACGSTGERAGTANSVALIEANEQGLIELQAGQRTVVATFCGADICKNCGLVSLHALGALDLGFPVLPTPELN